ncbi:hypothetical protein V3C99_007223 [Haemonchus contortus]
MLLQLAVFLTVVTVLHAATPTLVKPHILPLERKTTSEEEKWRSEAIEKLWDERKSMGHTPLVKFQPKGFPNVDIYFKNETASKTQTLKHRFAWALIAWAIIEGKVHSNSTVYDSTSGNTGASEAYMCTLVGLPYIAVVAKELEKEKIKQITSNGGKIMKVDVSLRNFHAEDQAKKNNGFFINQFGNAQEAEEFHESGGNPHESTNMFHEILLQLEEDNDQKKKIPDFFVHNSGTGGTITSVGRYVKRYNLPTTITLSDSEYSLFYDYVISGKFTNESGTKYWKPPGVAGIGYGYNVKPVIYGETTRKSKDIKGRLLIVTVMCDPGEFYNSTYFNSTWIDKLFADRGGMMGLRCWKKVINKSIDHGTDFLEEGLISCPGAREKRWVMRSFP